MDIHVYVWRRPRTCTVFRDGGATLVRLCSLAHSAPGVVVLPRVPRGHVSTWAGGRGDEHPVPPVRSGKINKFTGRAFR